MARGDSGDLHPDATATDTQAGAPAATGRGVGEGTGEAEGDAEADWLGHAEGLGDGCSALPDPHALRPRTATAQRTNARFTFFL